MKTLLRPALVLFALMTVLTGIVYPLAVTGIANAAFPNQASGSLLFKAGKPVGSALIGQSFSDPKYFWSRPSATSPMPYNGSNSSGSNQGPLNPVLIDAVKARIGVLKAVDPTNALPIPVDLVTASASGLDPHISLAAAQYQAARVARARGLPVAVVQSLIATHTQDRWLGVLGEVRVNVLALNLALDRAGAR
ncbi:MAG TPA: potassium-transporting ATPase subunit KdpC [Aromatoleum sp.]|uniref:potassium-transporting ATPase subunit KdpC n=1 Tax=Aromatoleum sp. TaxID=2307007 RepID=UPI002B4A83A6|nr:potassium-transporting ATPase subunit KdpC [Aromatoleum sp.]HJV25661.1 potassium-transporting ATPase subunit KdpC [Aromatoleum sp.]